MELRSQLSMLIYKEIYSKVAFLKEKRPIFLSWICPQLTARVSTPNETIYYEDEELLEIFFIKSGRCNYVLPKFGHKPFINIVEHTCFGLIDFVAAIIAKSDHEVEENNIMKLFEFDEDNADLARIQGTKWKAENQNNEAALFEGLNRKFTVRGATDCFSELLLLSKDDLRKMKNEFDDEFAQFFGNAYEELHKSVEIRLKAMDYCKRVE